MSASKAAVIAALIGAVATLAGAAITVFAPVLTSKSNPPSSAVQGSAPSAPAPAYATAIAPAAQRRERPKLRPAVQRLASTQPTALRVFPIITATGSYQGSPGFDRGMATTQQCVDGSWVRASATVDPNQLKVVVTTQLETDSVKHGAHGQAVLRLTDGKGDTIFDGPSPEHQIPAKPPGRALVELFDDRVDVLPVVIRATRAAMVGVRCLSPD